MEQKVKFFRKKLEFIFSKIYIILGIIIGIFLVYFRKDIERILSMVFKGISEQNNDILTGIIIAVITAIPCFFSSRINKIKDFILHFKSKTYNVLLNSYKKRKKGILHYIIPKLIKIFYSYDRFVINEQQQLTTKILDTLLQSSDVKKNIFWIIGDAYSGKTSAILNLLTDLITKEQYYKLFETLDNQIQYFDCGRDDYDMSIFFKEYTSGKYKRGIVIIDNVHKITQDNGIRQINDIVQLFNAFALVIIMRPLHDFIMQKEVIDSFEYTINQEGYQFSHLSQIRGHDYKQMTDFWEFIDEHKLNEYCDQDIILFHFIKIYLKSKDNMTVINSIANFVNNKKDDELAILLRYIIVATIFTGSFNKKIILKETQKEISRIKSKNILNQLYNIGFLNIYPSENCSYYFFHEELAKFYFEKTYALQSDAYNIIFEKYYSYYKKRGKYYLAYLYSILNHNLNNKKLFERIAININYRTILKEFNYLIKACSDLSLKYHKERGILYDRCGELSNAKKEYVKYYKTTNIDEKDKIDAFYKIVQVDHSFYVKHLEETKKHTKVSDVYSKLLTQYWCIHMNMHYGKFEVEKMLSLINELNKNAKKLIEERPYDSLHLMRRSFFDLFRLYYISGEHNCQKLNYLNYKNVADILKRKLEEYQAYYNKFVYGHYLLYEVLFNLGIFGERISKEEYDIIFANAPNIKFNELFDIEKVMEYALYFYKKSYDYLYNIGDKTYYFVNCRYMETFVAMGNYDIPKKFFLHFQSYAKNENIDYYQACAEIYLFKVEFLNLFSQGTLLEDESIYINRYFEIQDHLKQARYYFKQDSINPTNSYAEVMLDLYESLFIWYTSKKDKDYLKTCLQKINSECIKRKYLREQKIIQFIEKKDYLLSPSILKNIICYYPFVAQ